MRIDDAISILKTLGSESLMCNTYVVDAFKLILISQKVNRVTESNEGTDTSTREFSAAGVVPKLLHSFQSHLL